MHTKKVLMITMKILLVCFLFSICMAVGSALSGLDRVAQQRSSSQVTEAAQASQQDAPRAQPAPVDIFLPFLILFPLRGNGSVISDPSLELARLAAGCCSVRRYLRNLNCYNSNRIDRFSIQQITERNVARPFRARSHFRGVIRAVGGPWAGQMARSNVWRAHLRRHPA